MRTALLADIHANVQALSAVLVDVRNSGVEDVVCLGDIVGYGADPGKCVDLIRGLTTRVVKGNHDHYTTLDSPQMNGILSAADVTDEPVWSAIKYARDTLSEEQLNWLRELELVIKINGAVAAHAALHDAEAYLRNREQAQDTLDLLEDKVGFFGHTHLEKVFVAEGSPPEPGEDGLVRLPAGAVAVTIGSVGQPRDGGRDARWAIWDPDERTVEFRQVSYDVQSAAQAILEAGISPLNALRLFGDE